MEGMPTAILLAALFAVSATLVEAEVHYNESVVSSGGCAGYTCGTNAKCSMSDDRPMCSCLNLHMGDPFVHCHKVECQIDDDCPPTRKCGPNNECIDPCVGLCGTNAYCNVNRRHAGSCICLTGYTGNPFSSCQIAEQPAACKPCGANTRCEVINEVVSCSCLPGYIGSPPNGCRHECESDSDCPPHLACSVNFECKTRYYL